MQSFASYLEFAQCKSLDFNILQWNAVFECGFYSGMHFPGILFQAKMANLQDILLKFDFGI